MIESILAKGNNSVLPYPLFIMPTQTLNLDCECFACTHKFSKGNVSIPLEWIDDLDCWGLDPDKANVECPNCGSKSIGFGDSGETLCGV